MFVLMGGDIYKQTGGSGDFSATGQTTRNWVNMCSSTNGIVYATADNIYRMNSSGIFESMGVLPIKSWNGITISKIGDLYAVIGGAGTTGGIYKLTNTSITIG